MIRSSGLEALNHDPADNLNTAGIHVASTAAKRHWLFRDHSSRRGARRLFRRRDHECDPGIPAIGPVLVGEFPIASEVEIALRRGAQGNDESELRADADNLRLEAADAVAGAAVAADLLIDVAHSSDQKLLGQELRGGPIEVHVDAVLILRRLVGEIVDEAE